MYIAIEGCIGSGKTTVAKLLTDVSNCNLILEEHQSNPFLNKFYTNPAKYALETELAFLLIHYHQLFHEMRLQNDYIVDFCVSKDLLFAEMNLNQVDLTLFKSFFTSLIHRLPMPDIMICLKCSDELILKRVKQRNQGSENFIDPHYFLRLNGIYDKFFFEIKVPKIEVDMNEIDFINSPESITWLSNRIDKLKLKI